jgi:conjugal transfer/entry exclusion protein
VAIAAVVAVVAVLRVAKHGAQARPAIDPFTVGEPWRQLVAGALKSQARYRELVAGSPPGAVREQLLAVGGRIDEAVDECWAIAQQGNRIDRTASQMRIEVTRTQLAALQADPAAAERDAERVASLQARLDSHARLVQAARKGEEHLRLLEARLQESAARGAELAVAGSLAPVAALESEVGSVTTELESLRAALEETSRLGNP